MNMYMHTHRYSRKMPAQVEKGTPGTHKAVRQKSQGQRWPGRHPHLEVIKTSGAAVGCIPELDGEASNTLAEEHGETRLG